MSRPLAQIDDEIREMNDEEFADYQSAVEEYEARLASDAEKATRRAEILERLGLTEDEAKLILG